MGALFGRLKPNFILVVAALLFMAWLYKDMVLVLVDSAMALVNAGAIAPADDTPGAVVAAAEDAVAQTKNAAFNFLGAVVGSVLLMAIVSGLVMALGKLLDERPPEAPTVPASTHEKLLDRDERMGKLEAGLARLEKAIANAEEAK